MYSETHHEQAPSWARRAKTDSPITFRAFIAVTLFSAIAVSSGIGYLKQKEHTEAIGADIKQLESDLEKLRLKNQLRETEIERLKSPQRLEAKIAELNLDLAAPKEEQILRIGDPTMPEFEQSQLSETRERL